MFIEVKCPTCGNVGQVTDAMVGKAVKCKQCGDVFKASIRPSTPPPARPAASAVPSPPPAPAPDEPPAFGDAIRLANVVYQVVSFLASVGGIGCVILLLAGLGTGHAVEALVIVALAGLQMFFGVIGAMLVVALVRVFVGLARDVRAVRKVLGKE